MYTLDISRTMFVSYFVREPCSLQQVTSQYALQKEKKQVPLFGLLLFEKMMLLMYTGKAQQLVPTASHEELGCFQQT